MDFLTNSIPGGTPIEFKPWEIPNDKFIHKGTFNPGLNEYYFTVSDKQFERFDVFMQKKENGSWSEPEQAFFNSKYSEHGMSFSPDGKVLFFSSTRPSNMKGIPETWHIWSCIKIDGKWSKPVFLNIPNVENKLVSHPSISSFGTMYFHASNLDFSEMDIYFSKQVDGNFEAAQKALIELDTPIGKCTPYISPTEDYLIFASIGEELDLFVTFKDGFGKWTNTKKLSDKINNKGQGNPYVTADDKFLFYTAIDSNSAAWKIMWINIEAELKAN
ncbi:hypothetical protein [Algoriphagus limi]|uniref:WD40-like Beta Propeller Repeat n=1 Tax=Algoriphagus limi TaxID=2975273 RepID=A0ABT2G763_9BACT|nr:hypothetical protein [Algoriphagus limi]MCS5491039.1 hypothetical protein [Algoriphagus limi]